MRMILGGRREQTLWTPEALPSARENKHLAKHSAPRGSRWPERVWLCRWVSSGQGADDKDEAEGYGFHSGCDGKS